MGDIFSELRRRNVFRVAAAYAVVGWIIMQVVSVIEDAAGLPEWADSFSLIVLLTAAPVVLFIAWAFELTPEGVKKTEAPEGTVGFRALGNTDYVLIGLLGLVVAVAGFQIATRDSSQPDSGQYADAGDRSATASTPTETTEPSAASIAVLPFADLSPQSDQEYFSDGISEEILNVLVRVSSLDVASRTSAFQFKGSDQGIPAIADILGVRHVLEGSVRKDGDTIRITAQLIDARDDRHLWSETYDRPLTAGALFSVQDEIATAIVRELSNVLGLDSNLAVSTPVRTDNLTAYESFLQARTLFNQRYQFAEALALAQQATEADPQFAEAWALQSAIVNIAPGYGVPLDLDRPVNVAATELAEEALEIDPDNALALAILSKVKMDENTSGGVAPHDWADILAGFEAAIEADPQNIDVLNWRSNTYSVLGFLDEEVEGYQACTSIDPFYGPCRMNICIRLSDRQQDEAAMQCIRSTLSDGINPNAPALLRLYDRTDQELAFLNIVSSANMLRGWPGVGELYEAYREEDDNSEQILRSIENWAARYPNVNPNLIDQIRYDLTGVTALSWLTWWSPRIDWNDPEFRARLEREGVVDYWRNHGFPPQCEPVGEDDYTCSKDALSDLDWAPAN